MKAKPQGRGKNLRVRGRQGVQFSNLPYFGPGIQAALKKSRIGLHLAHTSYREGYSMLGALVGDIVGCNAALPGSNKIDGNDEK